jgi:hypothetical protein
VKQASWADVAEATFKGVWIGLVTMAALIVYLRDSPEAKPVEPCVVVPYDPSERPNAR